MQVAVAGVEHVGDREPELPLDIRAMARSTSASRARGIVPSMQ